MNRPAQTTAKACHSYYQSLSTSKMIQIHSTYNIQYINRSDGSATQNQIFGYLSAPKKWIFKRQDCCDFGMLHFEKSANLAKNEEMPCSTCRKPISPLHFENPKPRFRVPNTPSLIHTMLRMNMVGQRHNSRKNCHTRT